MEFTLQRPEPGKWGAAVFSLLMHGLLVAVLFYGVQWQSRPPAAVSVELVRSLPPAPVQETLTPPVKEVVPPKPVEVKPVEVKPAPVIKPDIAIKEPEKKKPEKKKEEPKPVPPAAQSKPVAKPVEKPQEKAPPMSRMEQMLANEAAKAGAVNNQNRLNQAAADARARQDALNAAASLGSATGDWMGQIAQKVKSNLMRPPGASGNPVVEFKVELLPSGEIMGEPKLNKSSGNGSLDEAVRRAILKSSPLPKPTKGEVFQRELILKFHPLADGE